MNTEEQVYDRLSRCGAPWRMQPEGKEDERVIEWIAEDLPASDSGVRSGVTNKTL